MEAVQEGETVSKVQYPSDMYVNVQYENFTQVIKNIFCWQLN